jgi:hypothetical protein
MPIVLNKMVRRNKQPSISPRMHRHLELSVQAMSQR